MQPATTRIIPTLWWVRLLATPNQYDERYIHLCKNTRVRKTALPFRPRTNKKRTKCKPTVACGNGIFVETHSSPTPYPSLTAKTASHAGAALIRLQTAPPEYISTVMHKHDARDHTLSYVIFGT